MAARNKTVHINSRFGVKMSKINIHPDKRHSSHISKRLFLESIFTIRPGHSTHMKQYLGKVH